MLVSFGGCIKKPVTLLEKAEAALASGNYEDAKQLCDQQLQIQQDDADALVMRGRVLALLERHEEAVADFSRVIKMRPDDYESLYRREHVYKKLGMTDLAMKDQERAKSLDPTYKSAYPYEPGAFIHRSRPPDPTKPKSLEGEGTRAPKESLTLDSPELDEQGEQTEDATSELSDADQPRESELSRGIAGPPTQRDAEETERPGALGVHAGSSSDDASTLTERKRRPLRSLKTGPPDAPGGELKEEGEEKEKLAQPLPVRPSITTALPIPRGDVELPSPYGTVPGVPSTGLQPSPTSRPFLPTLPSQPQGPLSTGLPVYRPESGITGLGGTQGPMTTGLQRHTAPTTSGQQGYPLPGTPVGPYSAYLRRFTPAPGTPTTTGSTTRSTSLPGTELPSPRGVISTAVPGRELPLPPKKISTALPESAAPPR
jgi:hypothetical protein